MQRKKEVVLSDNVYKIFETDNFLKQLNKIDQHIKNNITNRLSNIIYPQLRNEPHYGINIKKLRNYSPDTWRYRIGKYRFFYEIEEEVKLVDIIAIETRQNAY
jgi:mRNA interferase RelE/StbE